MSQNELAVVTPSLFLKLICNYLFLQFMISELANSGSEKYSSHNFGRFSSLNVFLVVRKVLSYIKN